MNCDTTGIAGLRHSESDGYYSRHHSLSDELRFQNVRSLLSSSMNCDTAGIAGLRHSESDGYYSRHHSLSDELRCTTLRIKQWDANAQSVIESGRMRNSGERDTQLPYAATAVSDQRRNKC